MCDDDTVWWGRGGPNTVVSVSFSPGDTEKTRPVGRRTTSVRVEDDEPEPPVTLLRESSSLPLPGEVNTEGERPVTVKDTVAPKVDTSRGT